MALVGPVLTTYGIPQGTVSGIIRQFQYGILGRSHMGILLGSSRKLRKCATWPMRQLPRVAIITPVTWDQPELLSKGRIYTLSRWALTEGAWGPAA